MKPFTEYTAESSFGPVHLKGTDTSDVMATFKPSIWPKVDLFFSLAEAQDFHRKLGIVINEINVARRGLCGKVCSGTACTMPKGTGCPDCTVSLHDVGASEL